MTKDKNSAVVPLYTSKLGDHPVGDAIGAAIGAAAGVAAAGSIEGGAVGSAFGLPGMAAGVVIGGLVGAMAGEKAAESMHPTVEDAYWRKHYKTCPYYDARISYDDYAPAYHHGIEGYETFSERKFDEMEPYLAMEWKNARGNSCLEWDSARPAVRDAYERLCNENNQTAQSSGNTTGNKG